MAALLLLGFALRSYHLDAKDMWVDEAHPWWFASLPILDSIRLGLSAGAINSSADPLYNILLHYWISLTGDSLYSLRYLSVITNLLGAAYVGRVAARAFGWQTGRMALLVGAIAPIWVFYSQEMRPYAFTPALMLVMVEAALRIARTRGLKPWPWIVLTVGEALSIYTHGFMVFGVLGINLWIGALWLRKWGQPEAGLWLRNWVISQLTFLMALTPVISLLLARAGGIRNPFTVALTPPQFATELWAYFIGIPWEDVFDPIPLRLWVTALLILVGLGLAFSLRREGKRYLADLFWLVLGLGFLTMLYDWRDPSFHPRYAIFLTGPLYIIIGAVIARAWGHGSHGWWLSGSLLIVLAIVAATSIDNLYVGRFQGYRHPSTRVVTQTLKTEFGPQDGVVVVAPHDFTLNYYGHGDAPLAWSRFDEGIEQPADLLTFIQDKQRIGLLRNTNEHSDSRRILPFYLDRFGSLTQRQLFEGYDLSIYRLDQDTHPQLADFKPITVSWGTLSLDGLSIDSGDAVTVALHWKTSLEFKSDARYKASLRLVDPVTHWDLGSADVLFFDDRGLPSDWWQPGETTALYFVLPLQPGTPPIDADLIVSVYDSISGKPLDVRDSAGAPAGQQVRLGSVRLGTAPDKWAYSEDERPWRLNSLASGPLSGYLIDQPSVAPGGTLGVTLAWRDSPQEVSQKNVNIQIMQNGVVVAQDDGPPLQGRAMAQVAAGESWLDRRLLRVSQGAGSGPAELMVNYGNQTISLAKVGISGIAHTTQRPPVQSSLEDTFGGAIKLIGYGLNPPQTITSQDTLPLTLYWQALADGAPEANYKVFTQLLGADGHLVGQHDGVPVNETRPFSGWLSGEYLVDQHPMTFNTSYVGMIHIQIGLYDPTTLQRVLTSDGKDAILLPVEIRVVSAK